ncbi:TPA: hypothetical protein HA242_07310 [Candidatus Woesearchaeota archaeon]|nr:hypothetical protein [Candidatus Woesearchaeota archaeon]HIG93785.1 hypothetical protein [Candidatus Woesearchaeota archaeon]HIH13504.1 hypothetical protein [Candidatus Woesearchaeota archaeon]
MATAELSDLPLPRINDCPPEQTTLPSTFSYALRANGKRFHRKIYK